MKSNLALAIAFDQMQATVKVKEELKACSTWAEIKVAVAKQENEEATELAASAKEKAAAAENKRKIGEGIKRVCAVIAKNNAEDRKFH